jgi:hypothetical protein
MSLSSMSMVDVLRFLLDLVIEARVVVLYRYYCRLCNKAALALVRCFPFLRWELVMYLAYSVPGTAVV